MELEEVNTFLVLVDKHGIALVVIGLVVIGTIWAARKFSPYIIDYLTAKKAASEKLVVIEAERNEVTRNNTAAMNNNTAALEANVRERDQMIQALAEHEKHSQERDLRSEHQNNDIRCEVGKTRGDLAEIKTIVKERLK